MKLAFATGPNSGQLPDYVAGQVTLWGNFKGLENAECVAPDGDYYMQFASPEEARSWAVANGFGLVDIPGDWDSLTLAQCLMFARGELDGMVLEAWRHG